VGAAAEDHQQQDGKAGQDDDAVAEDQPVSPVRHLPGHEAVACHDGGETGKSWNEVLTARNRMRAVAAWML